MGKCAIFGKLRHTLKNVPPSEKCDTLGKMRHSWKNAAHFEKSAKV